MNQLFPVNFPNNAWGKDGPFSFKSHLIWVASWLGCSDPPTLRSIDESWDCISLFDEEGLSYVFCSLSSIFLESQKKKN